MTALRVGLNLLHLVPRETGGGETYARRLVPALIAVRADLRLTIFVGREAAPSLRAEPWAGDVELARVPVHSRSRARRVLAEQTLLPVYVWRARVGLLHNLFGTAPSYSPVPQVTTIHDVIFRRFPDAHSPLLTRGLALLVPLGARRSRRILTGSQAAREDIVRFLGVESERIDVTPYGPGMSGDVEPVREEELRRRLSLGDAPIVLTASAKRPHKNLERLIDAVAALPEPAPVLVAPGYPTFLDRRLQERAGALGGSGRIRLTDWLDDGELEGLYRAATCFVFPSLAEGFGLPVLEAMARGTPVACSRIPPLQEVAGEAALYFDPTQTDAIGAAISTVLRDDKLRERLRIRGFEQARKFSWERTAEATLESYERALVEN